MNTYKRTPREFSTGKATTDVGNKYLNQMNFTGLKKDENIYAIDQESFADAKNVYVDDENRLVSRLPLQKKHLPLVGFTLENLERFGSTVIQILVNSVNRELVVNDLTDVSKRLILNINTKYKLCSIDHYIICFNEEGAKIIDTTKLPDVVWQNFEDFIDIPVFKTVIGNKVTEHELNMFDKGTYKTDYLWSSESTPNLPNGKSIVKYITGNYTKEMTDIGEMSNIRLNKEIKVNKQLDDEPLFSCANGIICLATPKYVSISYNGGVSYTDVYYPEGLGEYLYIASISDDGNYFFVVFAKGVYRLNLGDKTWADPILPESGDISTNGLKLNGQYLRYAWDFVNQDTFCFIVRTDDSVSTPIQRVYFYGPGLLNESAKQTLQYRDSFDNDTFTSGNFVNCLFTQKTLNSRKQMIKMKNVTLADGSLRTYVLMFSYLETSNNYVVVLGIRPYCQYYSDKGLNKYSQLTVIEAGSIGLSLFENSDVFVEDNIYKLAVYYYNMSSSEWNYRILKTQLFVINGIKITNTYNNLSIPLLNTTFGAWAELLLPVEGGFIQCKLNIDNPSVANLVVFSINQNKVVGELLYNKVGAADYITDNNNYYICSYENGIVTIITNNLDNSDSYIISYTTYSNGNILTPYKNVPTITYSDTELYLAFNKFLSITKNSKDGDTLKFNLPTINDQTFIDDITAMTTISTSEVAIFFKNKIVVCSKITNEDNTYAYYYNNTKLSTGVRLGDSVVNTLEGTYTIFPTLRGLAVMNYQAFMATTDQTLEYITATIKELWTEFYKVSSTIEIVQWREYLVITNNSDTILLYDIENQKWWRWEVPLNVLHCYTDQVNLSIIKDDLLTFEKSNYYADFSNDREDKFISWYFISQPLHFNTPNYYKNIRQLIFQVSNITTDDSTPITMNAQIKLYRKQITVRDPETIGFKIESLRTFVKRFNYWKINELQWSLSNDDQTDIPQPLELNGISIKYEIGEEVR